MPMRLLEGNSSRLMKGAAVQEVARLKRQPRGVLVIRDSGGPGLIHEYRA